VVYPVLSVVGGWVCARAKVPVSVTLVTSVTRSRLLGALQQALQLRFRIVHNVG
jgi:hypothetical protein